MKLLTVQAEKVEPLAKVNLVALFCFSACILCSIRLFSPLFIGSDSSAQIGAALGLRDVGAMGNYVIGADLAQPPNIELLTWFAPALSVFLFLLMKVGLGTETSLKIIYTIATIAGWYGWGRLFQAVRELTNANSLFARGIAIVLSILLPIYFTFDWCGTDLLLWSVIPYVIFLLYQTYCYPNDRAFLAYVKVGALIGFAYSIRYAAVSLLVGQVCFLIAGRKFKQILYVTFGYLLVYVPVSVYRAFGSKNQADHVAIESLFDPQLLLSRVKAIFVGLKNTEYLLLSHLTYRMPLERVSALLIIAAIVLTGTRVLLKTGSPPRTPFTDSIARSASRSASARAASCSRARATSTIR
ncbi:MAG: hypothetical protein MUC48_13485 [Leptolyngbya sp. Prado105]|nr:hypothetical protein [Leptolyngbya sp. Prado105]